VVAGLLVSLDLADILDDKFSIQGTFKTEFRVHINDGKSAAYVFFNNIGYILLG